MLYFFKLCVLESDPGHGVPFTDEESIFGHLDSFCGRIRQVIEAVYTLVQYSKLATSTEGLPRPRVEDLMVEDESAEENALDNIDAITDGTGMYMFVCLFVFVSCFVLVCVFLNITRRLMR